MIERDGAPYLKCKYYPGQCSYQYRRTRSYGDDSMLQRQTMTLGGAGDGVDRRGTSRPEDFERSTAAQIEVGLSRMRIERLKLLNLCKYHNGTAAVINSAGSVIVAP